MTPLVREMVGMHDDAESFSWFDVGRMPSGMVQWDADGQQLTHLPFQRVAFVGREAQGHKFMLLLIGGDNNITVAGLVEHGGRYRHIDPFAYADTDAGLRLFPARDGHSNPTREDCSAILAIISHTLDGLETGGVAYQGAKRQSLINRKREANEKPALLYDWRTVVVAPRPRSEPAWGVHASPRQHERRGHWRTTAKQRRVWVRNCVVGDASRGTIFHDYKVKG